MGLDIIVDASVQDVLDGIEAEHEERFRKSLAILPDMPNRIQTRPGSYAGLHRLRVAYCTFMAWPLDETGFHAKIPGPAEESHLCNHSDCEGWYLPDMFENPVWADETSIGSSDKLLEELLEMDDAAIAGVEYEWASMFVAAVASVTCGKVIKFS
jgi:hypothetical protein